MEHRDPHGRPPIPDGDRYPVTSAPPVPRRQLVSGWLVAGLVLAVMVAGIAGWLS
ncbi:hypothetical protein [Verrucosispora sp. WMMD1129]|uniref:hypothetical protein n=1 Tax=Verrucosispora sp. WMMD1129 TaxID=3016093 RepID=UPI00249CBF23|nr:hypothetical protein [Verrucosispora sp. WMMD1129]WFE45281.1 hypothetical protein O7624_13450 [Verrucosispora sp. WMMD1129]